MRATIEYPDELDLKIKEIAQREGQVSRSAIIRKALAFFLASKTSKVKRASRAAQKRAEVRP